VFWGFEVLHRTTLQHRLYDFLISLGYLMVGFKVFSFLRSYLFRKQRMTSCTYTPDMVHKTVTSVSLDVLIPKQAISWAFLDVIVSAFSQQQFLTANSDSAPKHAGERAGLVPQWYRSWKYWRGIRSQCYGFESQCQPPGVKGTKGSGWETPPFNRLAWRRRGYGALSYSN